MIEYTITDDTNFIAINNGATDQNINKPYDVVIVDTSAGPNTGLLIQSAYEKIMLPYAQITSPISADINALMEILMELNNTQNLVQAAIVGTADMNLKNVGGAAVEVGVGAAGAGTQRVALDATLASRASEATLATRATEATVAIIGANTTAPSTGASTNVASSIIAVTLLALNASRKAATIFNDGSNSLYVKLGATPSLTSFTVIILGGGYYEVLANYKGVITGIWDVATGSARVTELT